MAAHFKQDVEQACSDECVPCDSIGEKVRGRHSGGQPHSHTRRAFVAGGVCLAAVAAAGAATPARAADVVEGLKAKAGDVSDLLNETLAAFKGLDFASASELAAKTSAAVSDLQSQMQGPLWGAAEWIPVLGGDIKAARILVDTLADLVDGALVPVSQALSAVELDRLVVAEGSDRVRFDVAAIQAVADAVKQAIPVLDEAASTVGGMGETHVAQLTEAVDMAREKIAPLAGELDEAAGLLGALPGLLGAEGERVYGVLAQNNVEIRSTGGLAGQCCRVAVKDGLLSLGEVEGVRNFMNPGDDEAMCVPLTDEEVALYSRSVGYMSVNVNCIPDFPRVCDIFSQLWSATNNERVDGFVAIDPIFLQMLMGLTQGTRTADGTVLDGGSTVRVLMHDTYWRNLDDYAATDVYFTEAASAALDCIMGSISSMDPKSLLQVVRRGIDGGNLLMWAADADEQAVVEGLGASGEVTLDPAAPQLGVYLNNGSWSKFEWYLDVDFSMGEAAANADGSRTYPCSLRLSNAMTPGELEASNAVITGGNPAKRSEDDMLEVLNLYAPAGGHVEVTGHNGQVDLADDKTYRGLQVVCGEAHVQIGAPAEITFSVTVSPEATQELSVRIPPTVQGYR